VKVLKIDFNDANAPMLFTRSLKETGFAVIENHPIQKGLIDQIYEQWAHFFAAPQKYDYRYAEGEQDGYIPADVSEKAKGYAFKDLKEFFNYYPSGKCPQDLRSLTQQTYQEMLGLASILLGWVQSQTPTEVAQHFSMPLPEMIKESTNTLLRVIHYPPLSGNETPGSVRSAAHEDINLLTLLPAATSQGLQVKDTSGEWWDVPCDYGSIIVNTGDMLQECSQYYYPSTTHRVVNPSGEEAHTARFSLPLFLHPKETIRLSERYTAGEYLMERLIELGLFAKA
jgi:isopenicillin N synthase-like dioxygenase